MSSNAGVPCRRCGACRCGRSVVRPHRRRLLIKIKIKVDVGVGGRVGFAGGLCDMGFDNPAFLQAPGNQAGQSRQPWPRVPLTKGFCWLLPGTTGGRNGWVPRATC
jgi:hypothetical protein